MHPECFLRKQLLRNECILNDFCYVIGVDGYIGGLPRVTQGFIRLLAIRTCMGCVHKIKEQFIYKNKPFKNIRFR